MSQLVQEEVRATVDEKQTSRHETAEGRNGMVDNGGVKALQNPCA